MNMCIKASLAVLMLSVPQLSLARGEIQHDAEHYMLLAQHGETGGGA